MTILDKKDYDCAVSKEEGTNSSVTILNLISTLNQSYTGKEPTIQTIDDAVWQNFMKILHRRIQNGNVKIQEIFCVWCIEHNQNEQDEKIAFEFLKSLHTLYRNLSVRAIKGKRSYRSSSISSEDDSIDSKRARL
jgi:predicted FMN-binding regulatory protein PaiB